LCLTSEQAHLTLEIALALVAALLAITILRHQLDLLQLVGLRVRAAGELIASAAWRVSEYFGAVNTRALAGLQYRGRYYRETVPTWSGWAVINPLLSTLVLFIPLVLADMELNALRISSMFGIDHRPFSSWGLDQVGGVLMALITVTLGSAVWDLLGGVPGAYVWQNLHPALRKFLALIFSLAIVANLVAAVILSVWVQADHDELIVPFVPEPTLLFNLILMACLHLAVLAAAVSLPAVVAIVIMVAVGVLRLLALVIWVTAFLLVVLFEAILTATVSLAYAVAYLGTTLQNWLCGFRWSSSLGLWPVQPPARPQPLPPAQLGGWRPQAPRILQLEPPKR
jgi:hypothetical protein